jgi:hypothetical protein
MKLYLIIRDGEVKQVQPLELQSDGTLLKGTNPLLDSLSTGFIAMGKDKLVALVSAKKYSEIPADCYAHIGVNPSGLEVISQDDYKSRTLAARTPAQIERQRISALYAKANQRNNADDDNNVVDYMRIKRTADAALAQWRDDYPTDAKAEKADEIESKADHIDELAAGALTYDADGSIDSTEQQARHDEYKAKAVELRVQASELCK